MIKIVGFNLKYKYNWKNNSRITRILGILAFFGGFLVKNIGHQ